MYLFRVFWRRLCLALVVGLASALAAAEDAPSATIAWSDTLGAASQYGEQARVSLRLVPARLTGTGRARVDFSGGKTVHLTGATFDPARLTKGGAVTLAPGTYVVAEITTHTSGGVETVCPAERSLAITVGAGDTVQLGHAHLARLLDAPVSRAMVTDRRSGSGALGAMRQGNVQDVVMSEPDRVCSRSNLVQAWSTFAG